MVFTFFESLLKTVVENWFIILPLSLFMYFGARFMESVTLFLVGILIGFLYISPPVMIWLTNQLELSTAMLNILPYIIAITVAIAFLAIYKIGMFVIMAVVSGGLIYFILTISADAIIKAKGNMIGDFVMFLQSDTSFFVIIGISIGIGIIGGIIGSKESKELFQVSSIILGSLGIVLSIYTFIMASIIQGKFLLRKLTRDEVNKLAVDLGPLHLTIIAVIFVVLCIFKLSRSFIKRQPKYQSQ